MQRLRRSTALWLTSQALCFCLMLQGTGIAQALPLPPAQTFVSQTELEAAIAGRPSPAVKQSSPAKDGTLERFADETWTTTKDAGVAFGRWLEDPWPRETTAGEAAIRVAQTGGMLPLPPRVMSAFLAASNGGQRGPPSPPGLGASEVEETPEAELASLLTKSASEQIPLLAGLNLISIPEEPADLDPAAVPQISSKSSFL